MIGIVYFVELIMSIPCTHVVGSLHARRDSVTDIAGGPPSRTRSSLVCNILGTTNGTFFFGLMFIRFNLLGLLVTYQP